MNRYFLEVSYMGTGYAGFQIQQNAVTIQSEVQQVLRTYLKRDITLTGSSRTDTCVHALQNYFHFDFEGEILAASVYNLNALLPTRIAVRGIYRMREGSHCRFDAVSRRYRYMVYRKKDPFIADRAWYFPYAVDIGLMQEAAQVILDYTDFRSFAKRNSQVKTFECRVVESGWEQKEGYFQYRVKANRFLRGMVRGLVGTMLQVGRGKIGVSQFREIIVSGDSGKVDFSVGGHGLYLEEVGFREGYFEL